MYRTGWDTGDRRMGLGTGEVSPVPGGGDRNSNHPKEDSHPDPKEERKNGWGLGPSRPLRTIPGTVPVFRKSRGSPTQHPHPVHRGPRPTVIGATDPSVRNVE